MFKKPTTSDFDANNKKWNDLDDLRSIASYRGFTASQIQVAIDAVGPNATSVAKHLHIDLAATSVGDVEVPASAAIPAARVGWNTLEDVRELALAEGCNAEQIAEAIEAAQHDPCKVARILHKQLLVSNLKSKRSVID